MALLKLPWSSKLKYESPKSVALSIQNLPLNGEIKPISEKNQLKVLFLILTLYQARHTPINIKVMTENLLILQGYIL